MFDEYLERKDVQFFIREIKTNDRYFNKNKRQFASHSFYLSNELALYIFYDALLKFKLIVQDYSYFSDYLEQLNRLYIKINSFDGLEYGISKLICKMVSLKLHIQDMEQEESKRIIIQTIYQNYIEEGYFIHGFNSSYAEYIKEYGFIPEIYNNYYIRFVELNKILKKYDLQPITKDFLSNKIAFTDDVVLGCYYSSYAPMFFYKFLNQTRFFKRVYQQDPYLIDSYYLVMRYLKRFMKIYGFSSSDKKFVLDLVQDQWNLTHQCKKKVSLLLVKRKRILIEEPVTLQKYLRDKKSIYEVVDRILCSKQKSLLYNEILEPGDFEILNLDYYYDSNEKKEKERVYSFRFLNTYGKVSLILLCGTILITISLLLMIIRVLGE